MTIRIGLSIFFSIISKPRFTWCRLLEDFTNSLELVLNDLGKSLVKMLLEAAGFQVVDLGIDVPTEQFIEAIKDKNADILAMSALLTTSMPEMQTVIRKFEAELRRKIKIIIGGAPITSEYGAEIGADAVGKDAIDGVNICKEW